jgi:plasminogen activator inhibitor 1 RNA-binding protein
LYTLLPWAARANRVRSGSEKQAAQSWGAVEGTAELNDEQAGEAIAQSEQKEAEAEDAEAESQEPEVKRETLDAYYARQAEARAALNAGTTAREVTNKGFDNATQVVKEQEDYVTPSGGKNQRKREQKKKEIVTWEDRGEPTQEARGGFRGRGGDRGPRGGDRGDRRGGAPRGRGAPRGGDFPRGGPRGGGRGAAGPNTTSNEEFPTLGSK